MFQTMDNHVTFTHTYTHVTVILYWQDVASNNLVLNDASNVTLVKEVVAKRNVILAAF